FEQHEACPGDSRLRIRTQEYVSRRQVAVLQPDQRRSQPGLRKFSTQLTVGGSRLFLFGTCTSLSLVAGAVILLCHSVLLAFFLHIRWRTVAARHQPKKVS